ncbi:MAG TPA: hypothetical protein VG738_05620 [Chitinophagaceae bacterium]|nr:hypothetical protein [Chitinophagaceae bacterium]
MRLAAILLSVVYVNTQAQTVIPFSSPRWEIKGDEAKQENFDGKACIKITNGSAVLKDAGFTNGIIEFDMEVTKARYFPGMSFRMQDTNNTEAFYVRPHQSGNPDAMQYYPEYNGAGGWQLYYGDGFGNAHFIPFDRWFHVKLLVKDTSAELYLDNEQKPALFIKKLYRPVKSGMIALENPWPVAARYANFAYTETNEVTLQSKPVNARPLPPGVFTDWQVSSPFDEALLKNQAALSGIHINNLSWQNVSPDDRGIVNLDKLAPVLPNKNTVFAKIVIHSDKEVVKKLDFGFSDRVNLYFNGTLLYSGADGFMSRDYRFLGTLGLYDAVYLHLKKGDNEVVLAVSESFGGWGVMAMLEDWQE